MLHVYLRRATKSDGQVWTWYRTVGEWMLHVYFRRAPKSDSQVLTWSSTIGECILHVFLQRATKSENNFEHEIVLKEIEFCINFKENTTIGKEILHKFFECCLFLLLVAGQEASGSDRPLYWCRKSQGRVRHKNWMCKWWRQTNNIFSIYLLINKVFHVTLML